MNKLDFTAHVIASLAWPAVVLLVILLTRRELRALLLSLRRVKYREFEADFAQQTEKIEHEAERLSPAPAPVQPRLPPPWSAEEILAKLLDASPRVATIEAFTYVEQAIREAASRHNIADDRFRGVRSTVDELKRRGAMPPDAESLFHEMREVRNKLTHITDADISIRDAKRYINAARLLAARISQI